MSRPHGDDECGSITLLTVGLLAVVIVLVVVVVNASSMFLAKAELARHADRAAMVAADAIDSDAFYANSEEVTLDLPRAVADARATLPADVDCVVTVHGDRVTVRLERRVSLPFSPPGFPSHATLVAEANSRFTPL